MTQKKETIEVFEPYSEDETFGVTYSFEEWLYHLEKTEDANYKILTSGEFVEYVKNAKGFMTNVVAKIGTDILEAKTRAFKTLEDLHHLNLDKTYMFQIIDTSGNKVILHDGEDVFDIMENGKIPEDRLEYRTEYKIRYAELP